MKYIYKLLMIAILAIIFVSCEKENKGSLFNAGQADKASFLTKSGNWDLKSTTFKVPIGRTSMEGEFTAPITVTAKDPSYTKVFTISSPAKFAAGADKAEITLGYSDISTINPASLSIIPNGMDINVGLSFPITLKIDEKSVAYANIANFKIATSSNLEFEEIGTAKLDSKGGWAEKELTPKIHKAKGVNVYKLIQPFGQNSIAFMIKSDGKTVVFPNQPIDKIAPYGAVSMSNVKGAYNVAEKKVTLTVGGYLIPDGRSAGNGTEIIYLP